MKDYKETQIIKHALMLYIQRPEATEKDIAQEKQLLEYYTDKAEWLREKYGIAKEAK